MPSTHSWTIPGAEGEPIFGDTHFPDGESVGVILLCHGFKGYKDYGFFPHLAEAAAGRGLLAHRFNFSHSGMTNRIATFERPDLFEKDTWGRQIADLQTVAEAIAENRLPEPDGVNVGDLPQAWFGHSRGGVTVILAAHRAFAEEQGVQPAAIIGASTPETACTFDESTKQLLREQGYVETASSRTGQTLRIGREWLEEIEADPQRFDPKHAIRAVECPILLVHGSEDPTVSPDAARALQQAAGDNAKLQIIDSAQHTYNCPNPLDLEQDPPAETRQMFDAACDFALKHVTG